MRIFVVTVVHMAPEIVEFSFQKFSETSGFETPNRWVRWVVLDNQWPLNKRESRRRLMDLTALYEVDRVMVSDKNLGGHGGANFVFEYLDLQPDDLVVLYDPDSNPISKDWGRAMVNVMLADQTLGYVSLIDVRCEKNRLWRVEKIAGTRVGFHPDPEMFNVTIFRGSMLAGGLKANSRWYGNVEVAMDKVARDKGLSHGYLLDYKEDKCPIDHPKIYTDWKREHAAGRVDLNFTEYLNAAETVV